MKLSKNERIIIALILSLLILGINIVLFINPAIDKIAKIRNEYFSNQNKINNLTKLEQEKEERKKKEKFYKYELELITQKLPNNVAPETYVTQIRNFANKFGVGIEKITFSEPEVINLRDVQPASANEAILKKVNSTIYNMFKDTEYENDKASDKILQYTSIAEDSVIKVNVEFDFSTKYENIKNFVDFVEGEETRSPEDRRSSEDDKNRNRIRISSIEFEAGTSEEEIGIIKGKMTLTFFGIKDSSIPVYDLWAKDINRGKVDFFSFEGSQRYDSESSNISDFDIQLYPITSDYPTVVIGKQGQYGSKIYGDNTGNENATIEIQGSNGHYQYRSKTQSISFPLDYSFSQFEPKTNSDLFIKIYSDPRLDNNDKSGINLTIINKSDREVQVLSYNDDASRPRVKYVIKK